MAPHRNCSRELNSMDELRELVDSGSGKSKVMSVITIVIVRQYAALINGLNSVKVQLSYFP